MKNILILKDIFIRKIRDFFYKRNYIEIYPDILCEKVIPESSIKLFQTETSSSFLEKKKMKLLPSPEYFIKIILSNNFDESVFSICKAFRNEDILTSQHLFEFLMLEYYAINFDYKENMELTKELIRYLSIQNFSKIKVDRFHEFTFQKLFLKYFDFDFEKEISLLKEEGLVKDRLLKCCEKYQIDSSKEDDFESLFNKMFFSRIQNNLPKNEFYFLIDYPVFLNTLSKSNNIFNQRWELWYNDIELSNCFSEETDEKKIKSFFEKEAMKISQEELEFVDINYFKKISNLPKCSGNALGIERLMMVILGLDDIKKIKIKGDR